MNKFPVGQAVTLSDAGNYVMRWARKPRTGGVILGVSSWENCRRVKWESHKWPETLHVDFIVPISPDCAR